MKPFIAPILNLPWSILFLIAGLEAIPRRVVLHRKPLALILYVRSFWFYTWLPGHKRVRAATLGNVILLGPDTLPCDLEHELVHVVQHQREPFIHPFLYQWQSLRYGYRQNKYEREAYKIAGNEYKASV